MKVRVNLTVEEELLREMKNYAAAKRASVSEMFEEYIKVVTRPTTKNSLVDFVDQLPTPKIPKEKDLVSEYYKDMQEKYGS